MPNYISELNLPVLNSATGQVESQLFTIKDPNASGGGGGNTGSGHVYTLFDNRFSNVANAYNIHNYNSDGLLLNDSDGKVTLFNRQIFNQDLDVSKYYYFATGGVNTFNEINGLFLPNFNSNIITYNNVSGDSLPVILKYVHSAAFNKPLNYDFIIENGWNSANTNVKFPESAVVLNCTGFNSPVSVRSNSLNCVLNNLAYGDHYYSISNGFSIMHCPSFNQPFSLRQDINISEVYNMNEIDTASRQCRVSNCINFVGPFYFDTNINLFNPTDNSSRSFNVNVVIGHSQYPISLASTNYNGKTITLCENINYYEGAGSQSPRWHNYYLRTSMYGGKANGYVPNIHINVNFYVSQNTGPKRLYIYDAFFESYSTQPGISYEGVLNYSINTNVDNVDFGYALRSSDAFLRRRSTPNIKVNYSGNRDLNFNTLIFVNHVYGVANNVININLCVDAISDCNAVSFDNIVYLNSQSSQTYNPADTSIKIIGNINGNTNVIFKNLYRVNNSSNIAFKGNLYFGLNLKENTNLNFLYLLGSSSSYNHTNGNQKNIYMSRNFESIAKNYFYSSVNDTTAIIPREVIGSITQYSYITVNALSTGNGYCNEAHNLYIYNNYIPD